MLTDQELITKILSGNKESYSFLVNKYKNMVFSICVKILENREDAEDTAQDVFVKAFFSLHKHKSKDYIKLRLFRIRKKMKELMVSQQISK